MRPATRGARMSPSSSSREGFRSSTREPQQRRERARNEINRHEPGASLAHRRRRQRDETPADGRQALAGGEDDDLVADGDGQSAGGGILADREIEERREILEREHLLPGKLRAASGRRPSRVSTV